MFAKEKLKDMAKVMVFYSISLAITVFAGHPETLFQIGIFVVLYFFIRLLLFRKEIKYKKRRIALCKWRSSKNGI
jgi:cell division protein FtsW (lipid II flippase)